MEDTNKLINRSKLRHYLLLASVISLCSSLLLFYPSSLLHYFNLYNFSSLPSQILSHTIDKNCMFLLCNGLLVFVGITRSFSNSDLVRDCDPRVDDDDEPLELCSSIQYSTEVEVKKFMVVAEEEKEEEEDDDVEEEGKENGMVSLDLEEEEGEEEEDQWLENEEILVEESVEEENLGLSTEQMNKKFDDFIRRMKEDLRIEAKRKLVIV
ncbi:hypothetical protein QN277_016170 [Acacia crassicarpa]|uniref:DUF4408 domain-containing protein n=1 Tax=Acacia crassicarpa TaxID=499986 RepID=A0AAE1MW35_9FABA|nr:hypothetical protein QN277_016170 [Acacia crassicarpa]